MRCRPLAPRWWAPRTDAGAQPDSIDRGPSIAARCGLWDPLLYVAPVMIETARAEETERIGERLGCAAVRGAVIGLIGPLGAGKTTLVRGLARGLGADERDVHSPTFITATVYRGRLPLTHVDLYRHDETLPPADWLAEILDGDGVAVVEWSERLGANVPDDVLWIEIEYAGAEDRRRLELRATGPTSRALLAALALPDRIATTSDEAGVR